MEVVSQSDYYGLPEQYREPVSAEKVADVLRPAPMFSGPARVDD